MPSLIRGKQTDQARRLALQLVVQLPDDVKDARAVLDETADLLEGYLIRGPHEAAGRRLVALPDSPPIAAAAAFWTGLAFLVLAPVAVGLAHVLDIRAAAAYVFCAGVVGCAIVFGRWYGVAFALCCAPTYNLFVIAPLTAFTWPMPVEAVMLSAQLALAWLAPALANNAALLRRGAAVSAGAFVPVALAPAALSRD